MRSKKKVNERRQKQQEEERRNIDANGDEEEFDQANPLPSAQDHNKHPKLAQLPSFHKSQIATMKQRHPTERK